MTANLLAGTTSLLFVNAALIRPVVAAPVEYVRVCSFAGTGFYYIPGTDKCAYSSNLPYTYQTAYGQYSTQPGTAAAAYGTNSFSNGTNSVAVGDYAFSGGDPFSASPGSANGINGQTPNSAFSNANTTAIGQGSQAGAGAAGQSNATAIGQGASANALNATAVGQGSQVTAANAVALGQGSVADQANTVSVGAVGAERRVVNVAAGVLSPISTDAVNGSQLFATNQQVATNTQNITGLQNGTAGPFRDNNTSGYATAQASGSDAISGGFGSVASGTASTAVGTGAQATQAGAVAIGAFAKATADPTTAVGFAAAATGNEASAFGAFATASGTNSTALGRSANAAGTNSVAVGFGASATQANSVAIGTGVSTTRANQVAIGTAGQTYTMAGLTSAQSLAAQSGSTNFVTTDANGNLASSNYGPSSIAALDGRVTNLEVGMARLQRQVREAFAGTAIALSLTGAVLPEGKTYAVSGGFGTYHGSTAVGFTGIVRLSDNLFASGGVGFGTSGRSNVGGRGSLMYAW